MLGAVVESGHETMPRYEIYKPTWNKRDEAFNYSQQG